MICNCKELKVNDQFSHNLNDRYISIKIWNNDETIKSNIVISSDNYKSKPININQHGMKEHILRCSRYTIINHGPANVNIMVDYIYDNAESENLKKQSDRAAIAKLSLPIY
ncbi:hypothetical protein DICPUDRAFT_158803 [Dictyostelium purpureum]|uniref:Uncharacterized protein n=1 Tax=Dictyostelium purpureum TaxID=5786 RepID=F1A2J0_DICPU|nr:uncharacterized protein DICPUDRAFT_158803 [Dictyostelium purpureum]EGC29582.1 hypothetical protein DICPUDRAFT_158803 [Dictyostelium purpureum]|eukprot:XP_003293884.1 hypothetical protein DICPUDRAFT_158803 [Dictyostelium purpureum]